MMVVADFNADHPPSTTKTRKKARAPSKERVLRKRAWKEESDEERECREKEREKEWKEKGEAKKKEKKKGRQNPRPEDEEWQRLILRALHREFPTGREALPLVECRVTINIDDAPFFSLPVFPVAVSRPFRHLSSTAIAEFILDVRGRREGKGREGKGKRQRKRERDG